MTMNCYIKSPMCSYYRDEESLAVCTAGVVSVGLP